ncbi:MAG: efflux RND transporter periplasmic adaptor subunit [Planctomycetes bacterium]|nr:efflux RND transporter periplasmic adaptor subunit [Planctomycetota bacterium]
MKAALWNVVVFAALIGGFSYVALEGKCPWAASPAAASATAVAPPGTDWCTAHRVPLSTCEVCNPKLARGGTFSVREREPRDGECPNTLVRVTLAPEAARRVNLQFHTVELRTVAETLHALGETQYPPPRYARVAPRAGGVVREVKAALGQDLEAGATLALVDSADYGKARSDFLLAASALGLAQQVFDREQALVERKAGSAQDLLRARTDLDEARLAHSAAAQRLRTFGLADEGLRSLAETKDDASPLVVAAPLAGTVVEASAVAGELAAPDHPLFAIANMDRLWVAIDVYENDLPRVEKDQRVVFTLDALPGRRFVGKVVAVAGEVDERTRTARVFADVKNAEHLLRARMFGRAEFAVKPPQPKLLVPKEAVQNDGDCRLVFVSPAANIYQARKIQVGTVYAAGYEVTGGLAAGEKVVTTGSFLLKTEVLRGQMGAG